MIAYDGNSALFMKNNPISDTPAAHRSTGLPTTRRRQVSLYHFETKWSLTSVLVNLPVTRSTFSHHHTEVILNNPF